MSHATHCTCHGKPPGEWNELSHMGWWLGDVENGPWPGSVGMAANKLAWPDPLDHGQACTEGMPLPSSDHRSWQEWDMWTVDC